MCSLQCAKKGKERRNNRAPGKSSKIVVMILSFGLLLLLIATARGSTDVDLDSTDAQERRLETRNVHNMDGLFHAFSNRKGRRKGQNIMSRGTLNLNPGSYYCGTCSGPENMVQSFVGGTVQCLGMAANCVIDGHARRRIFKLMADTTVKAIQFINGYNRGGDGGAIRIDSGTIQVVVCIFSNNNARYGGAIATKNWSNVNVYASIFRRNYATKGGPDIAVLGGRASVSSNTQDSNYKAHRGR